MFKFEWSNSDMLRIISNAYTGSDLKNSLKLFGLYVPGMTTGFYLGRETPEYILAASLACCQIGD